MQKRKTQRWDAGLQGEFNFMQIHISLAAQSIQQKILSGYRVDGNSLVTPIWRHNNV